MIRPGDNIILFGAGGHAKGLVEIITTHGGKIAGYTGPEKSHWLDAPWLGGDDQAVPEMGPLVLGFGAVTPAALATRLNLLEKFRFRGFTAPAVISPDAIISPSATLGAGSQILPGAIIHAQATIGDGAIINSGAIVEHDVQIADGAHVAPGAIILGGAMIGKHAMIGAGAVILPGAEVAPETLIAANTRFGA
ncbi:hypothetical protein [Aestuariispira insulae]|uniref:Acetyltransferase EpsM n=1 Tax=Aestuariispira insulae TaxID=1461337 RepID=A0A3D9HAG5_9PROT|nr:hypothetical protein [Aestuariispira insulae]RED46171.1 acetyltransferase EpsM [Aestuariispira insulae]